MCNHHILYLDEKGARRSWHLYLIRYSAGIRWSGNLLALHPVFTVSGVKAYSEVSQVQVADWPASSDGLWPAPASGPQQFDVMSEEPHLEGNNVIRKWKGDWLYGNMFCYHSSSLFLLVKSLYPILNFRFLVSLKNKGWGVLWWNNLNHCALFNFEKSRIYLKTLKARLHKIRKILVTSQGPNFPIPFLDLTFRDSGLGLLTGGTWPRACQKMKIGWLIKMYLPNY